MLYSTPLNRVQPLGFCLTMPLGCSRPAALLTTFRGVTTFAKQPHMKSTVLSDQRFFVVFFLLLAACVCRGEALPAVPKDHFNDYANVTSQPKRRELDQRLANFEKESSNQVVVAIFQKMDSSASLDDYTLKLANAWGVGQRGKNNGVILFVFIDDRKMRIQVGSGLTGFLTDPLCQQIVDQDLKPHFRKSDFDGGFSAGLNSILEALSKPKSVLPAGER
jgi:uncharacterized membrane protein YgcG